MSLIGENRRRFDQLKMASECFISDYLGNDGTARYSRKDSRVGFQHAAPFEVVFERIQ